MDPVDHRQADCEGCALPRAADNLDAAAVALDDAVAHGEPEARSIGALGSKERLEYPIAQLGSHSDPVVGETHMHEVTSRFGRDVQTSSLGHRIQRIENDVYKHFAQLRG